MHSWDTVIEQKTVELGGYLVGRTCRLDFSKPFPDLYRTDDEDLRRRILSLTQQEARGLGIGKSTLHYLRRNSKKAKLTISRKIRGRLKESSKWSKAMTRNHLP